MFLLNKTIDYLERIEESMDRIWNEFIILVAILLSVLAVVIMLYIKFKKQNK